MNHKDKFHTVRGYALQNQGSQDLTPSMEDYLEMIYRLSRDKKYTRINDLAVALNVQPPSATKMVRRLAKANYLKYERYGAVELTPKGEEMGAKLLKRHQTLESFFRLLGVTENLLKDTEKIEHSLSEETLNCISVFMEFTRTHPEIIKLFHQYLQANKHKLKT
ncbi:MAG TPA: transcriptional regulator MntR [Clostridia bacterium]|nr:transcriptional regulator MntR [Clostridia bacterium]